uniref:paired-like homeodomain transcription factor LEUTX n=1 Tax=Halichoerus grypus TaxID=9711 RepID=UPI00165A006C|nr:paired-like homeodomain transcription factor LEUTX [Halichoerus grypus]
MAGKLGQRVSDKQSLLSIPFAENPRYARRGRTHFSVEQLQALKRVFEETMYPDWATTEELISITHLDESVIKTWFKNQRVKRKKEQQPNGSNSSRESPNPTIPGKEEEESLPVTSANTHRKSPSISDASDHELPQFSENDEPGPSRGNSSWDSQPSDLQEICLGDSAPPWASSPYDIDQFIQLYALPGDDDPSSLDQYLSPKCRS